MSKLGYNLWFQGWVRFSICIFDIEVKNLRPTPITSQYNRIPKNKSFKDYHNEFKLK